MSFQAITQILLSDKDRIRYYSRLAACASAMCEACGQPSFSEDGTLLQSGCMGEQQALLATSPLIEKVKRKLYFSHSWKEVEGEKNDSIKENEARRGRRIC